MVEYYNTYDIFIIKAERNFQFLMFWRSLSMQKILMEEGFDSKLRKAYTECSYNSLNVNCTEIMNAADWWFAVSMDSNSARLFSCKTFFPK